MEICAEAILGPRKSVAASDREKVPAIYCVEEEEEEKAPADCKIILDVDLTTGVAAVAPECAVDAMARGKGGGLSAVENACAVAIGATEKRKKRKKKKFVCEEPEIELRIKDGCGESEVNVEV